MPAPAPRPPHDRWRDVDGTHICLFCRVGQAAESPESRVPPPRLHQRGGVVGRGLDSLYERFADNALVSPPPHVLHLLPDPRDEC